MAFVGYQPQKLPQHSTWIGAVAGGVGEAAGKVWEQAGTLVRGEVDFRGKDGKTESWPRPRTTTLKMMALDASYSFHKHTRSVADPVAFQRWNAAVERFQTGDKDALVGIADCKHPFGSSR